MSYERALNAEINGELDRLQADGKPMVCNWVTHSICQKHEGSLSVSEDAEFWRHGAYSYTRDAVRRQINLRAADREEPDKRQLKLPGYQHLQQYYVVKRPKLGEVGVHIELMTEREIDEKIVRYETMSVACVAHADELREYKRLRKAERRKNRRQP